MAQIDIMSLQKIEKERNTIHEIVSATYTVFEKDNNKYLQIDTYGKESRAIRGKISQSFQIDEEVARRLIVLLLKEFDIEFKVSDLGIV